MGWRPTSTQITHTKIIIKNTISFFFFKNLHVQWSDAPIKISICFPPFSCAASSAPRGSSNRPNWGCPGLGHDNHFIDDLFDIVGYNDDYIYITEPTCIYIYIYSYIDLFFLFIHFSFFLYLFVIYFLFHIQHANCIHLHPKISMHISPHTPWFLGPWTIIFTCIYIYI